MPVRDTLKRQDLPGEDELRAELKAELDQPKDAGEPDIVIERPNPATGRLST